DRRRDPVGLRRLLGHPVPDRGDPPPDRRGWERGLGGRQDPRPRHRERVPLGQQVGGTWPAVTARPAQAGPSSGGRDPPQPEPSVTAPPLLPLVGRWRLARSYLISSMQICVTTCRNAVQGKTAFWLQDLGRSGE